MKRSEIRTKIRYNIRESTASVWTNAELNYWINDVQKEVANLIHPSYNPKLLGIYSVSGASGTASYDLPTSFIQILGNADLNSNTYVLTPLNLVRPKILGEYAYDTNKKICWIQENDLFLHPTPGSSEDGKLIYFPYLKAPANFADDTTTDGDLGDVAYMLLVNRVSGLAWSKLDSEEAQREAKMYFEIYYNDIEKLNSKSDKKNDTRTIKT